MNKAPLLILLTAGIFLIVLLSTPILAKEEIFSGNVFSGQSIGVDNDHTFIITLNKYLSRVFVNGGDIFTSVPIDECRTFGEVYEACYLNNSFDEEANEMYANIKIYRRSPDILISKGISKSKLYVGEHALVTLTVKDDGDPVEKLTVIDDYPEEIVIDNVEGSGCFVHENSVSWSGHMDSGEEKTCSFEIYSKDEIHKELAAKVRWWDGLKWQTDFSVPVMIDTKAAMRIKAAIVRENYEVDSATLNMDSDNPDILLGEAPRLIIKLDKTVPYKVNVDSLDIVLPEGLKFIQTSYLRFDYQDSSGNHTSKVWNSQRITKVDDHHLRWNYRFDENSSEKIFVLKLLSEAKGLQNILLSLDYDVLPDDADDISVHEQESESFLTVDPGMDFKISLDDDSRLFSIPERLDADDNKLDLESLHKYRFTVYAQNLNAFSDISDVNFWIVSDLANFSRKHYGRIEKEKQVIPWSLDLVPPMIPEDKTFKLNVSSSYRNSMGMRVYNSSEFEFNVKAFVPISISHDSNEGFVLESKEKTAFSVKIKNDRLVDLKDVSVKDSIPKVFDVRGVTSNNLKLPKEEDTEVYKYEITAPLVTEKERFNITTSVHYFDEDLKKEMNYSKTSTITIIPRSPSVDLEWTFDEPSDLQAGSLISASLKITNNDDEESVRDLNVKFPVQRNFDLIGPKTLFVPKLDPGESVKLVDKVQFRPKVRASGNIGPVLVSFSDQYGNEFNASKSEPLSDVVEGGKVNGPAVFLSQVVSPVVNISAPFKVTIEARNLGNEVAKATVTAGKADTLNKLKIWNVTIPPYGLKTFEYELEYDAAGNYSLPEAVARIDYYGRDMYTASAERKVEVTLLTPETPVPEAVTEPIPKVEVEEPINETISDIEKTLDDVEMRKTKVRMLLTLGGIAAIVLIIVVLYIFWRKGKKSIESEKAPFFQ